MKTFWLEMQKEVVPSYRSGRGAGPGEGRLGSPVLSTQGRLHELDLPAGWIELSAAIIESRYDQRLQNARNFVLSART